MPRRPLPYRVALAPSAPRATRATRAMRAARVALVVALAVVTAPACGDDAPAATPSIRVTGAEMAAPTAGLSAVYFTIRNDTGRDDRLLSATSPKAGVVHLHRSVVDTSGQVTMGGQAGLPVRAHSSVRLRPGADHLMMSDVQDVRVGDRVPLLLDFERSGDIAVQVRVVKVVDPGTGG